MLTQHWVLFSIILKIGRMFKTKLLIMQKRRKTHKSLTFTCIPPDNCFFILPVWHYANISKYGYSHSPYIKFIIYFYKIYIYIYTHTYCSSPCIFHLIICLGDINIAISIRKSSLLFIISAYYICILYCVDI